MPLNSPAYPDPIRHPDPCGFSAGRARARGTSSIALMTGAIVLPLRHPLHVAKAAAERRGRVRRALHPWPRFGQPAGEIRSLRPPDRRPARTVSRTLGYRVAAALADDGRIVPDLEAVAADLLSSRDPHILRGGLAPAGRIGCRRQERQMDRTPCNRLGHLPPRFAGATRATSHVARSRRPGAPGAFRSFSVGDAGGTAQDAGAPAQPLELGWRSGSRALVDLLQRIDPSVSTMRH